MLRLLITSLLVSLSVMANAPYHLYVGTYTKEDSQGIYHYTFDPEQGIISGGTLAAETANPTFIITSANDEMLYAVNELGKFKGEKGGGVTAFRIDRQTGTLTKVSEQPVGSGGTCHLTLDRTERVLIVANYGGGSTASFPINEDGTIGPRVSLIQHEGSGPNEKRQKGPHAHGATVSPDNRFVLVPDLGTDRVYIYSINHQTAELTPHGEGIVPPGAGPRHVTFAPDGEAAYVINELDNTISRFYWNGEKGEMVQIDHLPTLPQDFGGDSSTAEIAVHPNGLYLYASNRGHNSIAIFSRHVDADALKSLGHSPTGGSSPRHFAIAPGGKWLLTANQSSDNITISALDPDTGKLKLLEQETKLSLPVCLAFAKAADSE